MLQLETFGGLTLRSDAGALVVTQRRRLALLVLVAAAGDRGITRDKLMAWLWPERSAEAARHSLEQLFYALRRDAGEALFDGTNPIRLNPSTVVSDSREFEQAVARGALADAAAHYRGPFLEGFFLAESPEFERWAEFERARLAALYARVLEALARATTDAVDHGAAADWWSKLVTLDPLRGASVLGLMRAFVATGDRASALRHARTYEEQLRNELGAETDPEVYAFVRTLRAWVPSDAMAAGDAGASGSWLKAGLSVGASRETSLAVLPFTYLGDDAEGEYFSDGVTDEILTALMKVDGLRVASRLSTVPFKAKPFDLNAIRDTLHVNSVLDGSVRRSAGPLRIAPRLTDAVTGRQIWAESYNGNLTDVFTVQAQIAGAIVSALRLTLASSAPLVRHHTHDPEAYNLYLKGATTGTSALGKRSKGSATSSRRSNVIRSSPSPTRASPTRTTRLDRGRRECYQPPRRHRKRAPPRSERSRSTRRRRKHARRSPTRARTSSGSGTTPSASLHRQCHSTRHTRTPSTGARTT